jgi:undecaprenyl-diphosphatase
MVIKKNYLYLFLLLIVIAFYFDNVIIQGFAFIRNSVLSQILLAFTWITNEIVVFAFLTLMLFYGSKKKWIIPFWATLALSTIISILLKIMTQRLRPFQQGLLATLPELAKISHFSWNLSFPSFNTMIMFCALPIINKQYPRLKKTWLILAILVALTRVYFGLHFLSDVLVGGLIGYLIGMWIIKLETDKRFFHKIVRKVKKLFSRFM